MADKLQFDDGIQFDDQSDDEFRDIDPTLDDFDSDDDIGTSTPIIDSPKVPTYEPSGIQFFVNGNTDSLDITVDGDFKISSPGSFALPFSSLLDTGVRIRATKTSWEPTEYFIVKTTWLQVTEEYDRLEEFDDTVNGDRSTVDSLERENGKFTVTFRKPIVLVQRFDKDGVRLHSENVNLESTQRVDLFFNMVRETPIIEPKPVSLFVRSEAVDSSIFDTQDDVENLFNIEVLNEDLELDFRDDPTGTFISNFPDTNQDIRIFLKNEDFKIVGFVIYKNNGEFDYEVSEVIRNISDTDELTLRIDKHLLVEVEYVRANFNEEVPEDIKPKIKLDQASFTYNVDDPNPPSIGFELLRGDGVRVQVGSRTFEPTIREDNRGRVELEKSDFDGIGQYKVFFIPFDEVGDGILSEALITVVQDPIERIAQFTEIEYPSIIEGADFDGYDTEFTIRYTTEQTQYVNIFVGDEFKSYGQFGRNENITLNVNELINFYDVDPTGPDNTFNFRIKLVPVLDGVDGREETLDIEFRKSRVQLPNDLVEDNIENLLLDEMDFDIFDINSSKYLTHIVNIEGIDYKLVSNWERDDVTFTETELDDLGNELPKDGIINSTLVLKLFEPLPTSVQPNTQLWISKIKSTPFIDRVTLDDRVGDVCVQLRPANFTPVSKGSLAYEMFDEIVASDSPTSTQIVREFVTQQGIDTSKLDIQYVSDGEYQFQNFVHFGSAEEQSINFLYKVSLLSQYEDQIDDLESSPSSGSISVQNDIRRINDRIEGVLSSFSGFEDFLYNSDEPLSYLQDENGDPVNESEWFDDILKPAAIKYDKYNENALVNNMPAHILKDNNNEEFIVFLNMIGQHYDILWSYINGIKSKNRVEQQRNTGIIDDLIYHMLESFGWDVDSSVATQQLWQAAFGLSEDGTVELNQSGTSYQNQIWRRLLNNLPYLLKHKGTRRTLQAIMATYGVPQSMLSIIEFGGPKREGGEFIKYTFDDLTSALKFTGDESIEVQWGEYIPTGSLSGSIPNSVELRVNPDVRGNYTLVDNVGNWNIQLDMDGVVTFQIETTDDTKEISGSFNPIYTDDFTSIMVNREVDDENDEERFTLYIRQSQDGVDHITYSVDSDTLVIDTSLHTTQWEDGTDLIILNEFVGLIDEFRLWRVPLDVDRFENHTLSPDSIDGNTIFSSTEDLLLRFDFERPKNRGVDTEIKNVAPNELYGYISGTAIGFDNQPDYPFSHVMYERRVTANVPSLGFQYGNKVRLDEVELISDLSHRSRATKRASERNPIDSNRLGLFFSPMKELNMDIVKTFGDFRIDDYIGDPSDEFRREYGKLKELREYYFTRVNLNIYEYIQLVRYVDKSLFDMLENGVPARTKLAKGLLIEPHLLDRPKVQWTKPTGLNIQEEAQINVLVEQLVLDLSYDIEIDASQSEEVEVGDLSYSAEIREVDETDTSAEQLDLFVEVKAQEDDEQDADYLTYSSEIEFELATADVTAINLLDVITQVGTGGDENPAVGGSGLYTLNGFTERVTYENGDEIRENVYVELITECRDVERGIYPEDHPSAGDPIIEEVCEQKLNFQPASEFNPTPGAVPVNGYLPSHVRNRNTRTTGIELSYYKGSKQTSDTTLDGAPAVETFVTNPNTLRVTDAGRGSGEPILEVD